MNVINNYKKILDLYISIFLYSSCKNQPFCSSGGGFLLVKRGLFDLLSVSMTSASVSLGVWAPVSGSMSVMSSPDWVIENSANLWIRVWEGVFSSSAESQKIRNDWQFHKLNIGLPVFIFVNLQPQLEWIYIIQVSLLPHQYWFQINFNWENVEMISQ